MPDPIQLAPAVPPVAADAPIITPFYLDKALWVTVLTPILLLLNQKFGIALDANVLAGFLLGPVMYVVMHKWKTATLQKAAIAGDAAVAAAKAQDPAAGLAADPK